MKEMKITEEMVLIGSLFQDPANWLKVRAIVGPDDFLDLRCGILFQGIENLDCKYDLFFFIQWLKKNNHSDLIDFATQIIDQGNSLYAIEYARIVKESSTNRKLMEISENIKTGTSIEERIREADSKLLSLYTNEKCGFIYEKKIAENFARDQMEKIKAGLKISGLSTGFKKIDAITNGLKQGELIIIGSRPSIGKTSMMISLADHIAVDLKKNVAIFSLESCELELFQRFISQRARITAKRLGLGDTNEFEKMTMDNALTAFLESKISINDTGTQTIFDIRSNIRQLINEGRKPDIIFIDYLQRMEVAKGNENYSLRIGFVTKGLKNIAKEMNIPVVALAQINRNNGEAFPRLQDLKESGEIEADADIVMLLQREEFYKKNECPDKKKGILEIDIAKNRNGPTDYIILNFEKKFMRITDSDDVYEEEE